MARLKLALISSAMFLGACASQNGTPIPDSFPLSYQLQVDAVRHWSFIAQDLASQVRQSQEQLEATKKPIFMASSSPVSSFERSLKALLTDALISQGVTISNDPKAPLKLQIDTHFVRSSATGGEVVVNPANNHSAVRPSHEILVSLKVLDEQSVYFSHSDVYYVFAKNHELYAKPPVAPVTIQKTFEVKGGQQ